MTKGEQAEASIDGAGYWRRTLLLVVGAVAAVAVVGGAYAFTSRSSASGDFREMHRKAVASMREQNLSGEAAARPFVGKSVEVDCVVGRHYDGAGGLAYAMRLDDQIYFLAGPHEDLDAAKWVSMMKRYEGQRVHLSGVVGWIEISGDWSPLLFAVTKVTEPQPSPQDPAPAINTRISCHEWFEMNSSQQADAAVAAGKQAQAEIEQNLSRKIVVLPGDYLALAQMFTAFCKSGATEDLYTAAKKTMAVAFANQ